MTRRVFVSAGELSGEHLAAPVVLELAARAPDVAVECFGGAHLAAAGARLLFPLSDLAALGFAAVFASLGKFAGVLRRYQEYLDAERPDLVVLVDYPGLHVRFAQLARRAGIPVFYFACPQLWAWAPWRARRFAAAVDRAFTILPFEERYLRARGVDATYAGSPALERLEAESRTPVPDDLARRLAGEDPIVALLPGSRAQEVDMNLPTMLRVAARLRASHPTLRFFLPQAHERAARRAEQHLAKSSVPVTIVPQVGPVLARSRLALVASGTATFEVAWHRVPMVVVYRITPWQRFLGGQLLTVPWVSLANLVAGAEIVPEFVGAGDADAEITAACDELLVDGARRARCLDDLENRFRGRLHGGAARTVADAVIARLAGAPASRLRDDETAAAR